MTSAEYGATVLSDAVENHAAAFTILASNSQRVGAIIFNDTDQILYMKFGLTASSSDHTFAIPVGGAWELTNYKGVVTGRMAAAQTGEVRITEWS